MDAKGKNYRGQNIESYETLSSLKKMKNKLCSHFSIVTVLHNTKKWRKKTISIVIAYNH